MEFPKCNINEGMCDNTNNLFYILPRYIYLVIKEILKKMIAFRYHINILHNMKNESYSMYVHAARE